MVCPKWVFSTGMVQSMSTDQMTDELDVIVVGAGLAGSVAALTVARAGYSVGVIECGPPRSQNRDPAPGKIGRAHV